MLQINTQTRAADSGAAAELKGNRGPPSALVRVASAFLYIVPWIDVLGLGREIYHFFPTSLWLYLLPGKGLCLCLNNSLLLRIRCAAACICSLF